MNDQPIRPDVADNVKRGDLRDMREARCMVCNFLWWAPVIGRCPKCRAIGAAIIEQLMIGAPRV